MLCGGLIPPPLNAIDSSHEPASGGNENSSGGALPRSLLAPVKGVTTISTPSPSQQNVALACLFATPVTIRLRPRGSTHMRPGVPPTGGQSFAPMCVRQPLILGKLPGERQLWLFGDLPLGSRSADPHSTAVWCGNLLHSSPQPHIAGCLLFTRWSTRYCNQDLHQKTLRSGAIPTGSAISHVLSTQRCSALLPQRWRTVRQIQLH